MVPITSFWCVVKIPKSKSKLKTQQDKRPPRCASAITRRTRTHFLTFWRSAMTIMSSFDVRTETVENFHFKVNNVHRDEHRLWPCHHLMWGRKLSKLVTFNEKICIIYYPLKQRGAKPPRRSTVKLPPSPPESGWVPDDTFIVFLFKTLRTEGSVRSASKLQTKLSKKGVFWVTPPLVISWIEKQFCVLTRICFTVSALTSNDDILYACHPRFFKVCFPYIPWEANEYCWR